MWNALIQQIYEEWAKDIWTLEQALLSLTREQQERIFVDRFVLSLDGETNFRERVFGSLEDEIVRK